MESNLTYRDELDIAQILYYGRDAIAAALPAGLPTGFFTREEADKIEALRAIGSVLDEDLKLFPKFRAELERVLAERPVDALTPADCRAIASQAHIWHELPFRDDWNLVVYRTR